jgi:hypothetical protein
LSRDFTSLKIQQPNKTGQLPSCHTDKHQEEVTLHFNPGSKHRRRKQTNHSKEEKAWDSVRKLDRGQAGKNQKQTNSLSILCISQFYVGVFLVIVLVVVAVAKL